MDLTKAFDKVNRTILWTTLYKKGLPIDMITHIRRGHQNTTLMPKTKGKYGEETTNNVGIFQGSAISALLFIIIYQDDMMDDYDALSQEATLPIKHTQGRTKTEIDQKISNEIRQQMEEMGNKEKQKIIGNPPQNQTAPTNKHNNSPELKAKYTQPVKQLQGTTKLTPADHQEYADDTILYPETETAQEITTCLHHYSIVTEKGKYPYNGKQKY